VAQVVVSVALTKRNGGSLDRIVSGAKDPLFELQHFRRPFQKSITSLLGFRARFGFLPGGGSMKWNRVAWRKVSSLLVAIHFRF
jgi:hypothetical protein